MGWIEFGKSVNGETGPTGPSGPAGPAGPDGPDAITISMNAYNSLEQAGLAVLNWHHAEIDTEDHDTGGDYDIANYKYVAPANGYYFVAMIMGLNDNQANKNFKCALWDGAIGGGVQKTTNAIDTSKVNTEITPSFSDILYLTSTHEYRAGEYNGGGNTNDITAEEAILSIVRLDN